MKDGKLQAQWMMEKDEKKRRMSETKKRIWAPDKILTHVVLDTSWAL